MKQSKTPKQRQVPVQRNEADFSKIKVESLQALSNNQIAFTDHGTSYGAMSFPSNFSGELKELDNQTTSLMVKTPRKSVTNHPLYKCTLCGKEAARTSLKNHIEVNHLEGISIPCSQCDKTFRSRNSVAIHKHREHNPSTHSDVLGQEKL